MKTRLTIIAAALVVTLAGSAHAVAIISVNFSGRADTSNTVPDTLLVESGTSSTGIAGVNGNDVWNDIIATGGGSGSIGATAVAGPAGEDATVAASWGGTWGASASGNRMAAAENPTGDMTDGHIEGSSPTAINITIADLLEDFSYGYSLYLYVGDDAGDRSGSFFVNGDNGTLQSFTSTVNPDETGLTQGSNYLVFSDLSSDTLTITGGGDDNSNRTGVWGFEIVGNPPPPVPEPSGVLLASITLAGLATFRRRRRR